MTLERFMTILMMVFAIAMHGILFWEIIKVLSE